MKKLILLLLICICIKAYPQSDTSYTIVPMSPEEQIYVNLFPKGKRAPWGYRIYEKWQMQQIHHIDTIHVSKYLRTVWMRGLIPFNGDTTKLIFQGWVLNTDYKPSIINFNTMYYPTYLLIDTVYTVPTLEGFEQWKLNGRPRAD